MVNQEKYIIMVLFILVPCIFYIVYQIDKVVERNQIEKDILQLDIRNAQERLTKYEDRAKELAIDLLDGKDVEKAILKNQESLNQAYKRLNELKNRK